MQSRREAKHSRIRWILFTQRGKTKDSVPTGLRQVLLSALSVGLNAHVGPHITLANGTFFIVFGVIMASLSTEYYQLLLSHGICSSVGIGASFMPVIGLPNQWYDKNRGLAVSFSLSGHPVGGLIWPITIDQILNHDRVGFAWTMRAIGFIQVIPSCTFDV